MFSHYYWSEQEQRQWPIGNIISIPLPTPWDIFLLLKPKIVNAILLKRTSFMSLLSSWPCSSGNFHSAFWDMQTMQNFTLLFLHKAPKSKTPAWDVACLPQPVWPAQSVCTGCLFPPRSHSWPVPGAPAVLPRTCSVRRFDRLTSYYIQTPFTELAFAEEWIILFDNTIFTSGEMWRSRHQISVSMFCLAIKVPDKILENLLHLFSNSL